MIDCCFKNDDTKGCEHSRDNLRNYQPPVSHNEVDIKESRIQKKEVLRYQVFCQHCCHSTTWWSTEREADNHWTRINPNPMTIAQYRALSPEVKR